MLINVTFKKVFVALVLVAGIGLYGWYSGHKAACPEASDTTFKQWTEFKWDAQTKDTTKQFEVFKIDWTKTANVTSKSRTTKKITETPDGTKVTEEVTETTTGVDVDENGKGEAEVVVNTDVTTTDKVDLTKKVDLTVHNEPDKKWAVTLGAELDLKGVRHLELQPTYYLTVSRTIYGPFAGGVSVNSEKTVLAFIEGTLEI